MISMKQAMEEITEVMKLNPGISTSDAETIVWQRHKQPVKFDSSGKRYDPKKRKQGTLVISKDKPIMRKVSAQKAFEIENKKKASQGKKLRGQQTLTSAVSTSRRLSEFEPGTLAIKGDKPKLARLARHLQKEHPSTKGKMALFDQGKKERLFSDIEKARKYAKKTGMKIHNTGDFYGYTSEVHMNTPFLVKAQVYDPAPVKLVSGIPAGWYEAMVIGIKKRSDVRNPYAIVKNIWARLPAHTRSDIMKREKAGERFHYDLPLPDDRQTHGVGTLRMVKPFNLAEAQVNVNQKDFNAVQKSGIFRPMKREDGSTCMVARCKGARPVNIFVDKV